MKTKKEIAELLNAGRLSNLMENIITDGTKRDTIDALYLLFKQGDDSYDITFESIPYSRGGKYARHTSTLHSTQSWKIIEDCNGCWHISTESTSKSGACPSVIIPKFYTEAGKSYYNAQILSKINELQKQLL